MKATADVSSELFYRDGTSQAGRKPAALEADYALIDERSDEELLTFSRAFAKSLQYYNDNNQVDGDWSAFLSENTDVLLGWLDDERVDNVLAASTNRPAPHLALFLTFIKLLRHAKNKINAFTQQHLDFYYQQVLKLQLRAGVADHVHLTFELASNTQQYLLPAGTQVNAGKDSQGNALVYASKTDTLLNQASVASLKSLYIKRQVLGLVEVYHDPELLVTQPKNISPLLLATARQHDRAFIALLSMSIGELVTGGLPVPGAALAEYPGSRVLDTDLLNHLDELTACIRSQLYMSHTVFRSLMLLKTNKVAGEHLLMWADINVYLAQAAGKNREANKKLPAFFIVNDADFMHNLCLALGINNTNDDIDKLFAGLPEVEDVYSLHRRQDRVDIQVFILQKLGMSLAEFDKMMQIVNEVHQDWRDIYNLLRTAAKKKSPGKIFDRPDIRVYQEDKFEQLLDKTLGELVFPAGTSGQTYSIDECYAEIILLEGYFHLSIEDFVTARKIHNNANAMPWQLETLFSLFEKSHSNKTINSRKLVLEKQHDDSFDAMIQYAFGESDSKKRESALRHFSQLNANRDEDYISRQFCMGKENFTLVKSVSENKTASDHDWQTVYKIIEQAQRVKRGWINHLASIEQWQNIYAAEHAETIAKVTTLPEEETTPHWRTFGDYYRVEREINPVVGRLGFAVASPLLLLSEGQRFISLQLEFSAQQFDQQAISRACEEGALELKLSTAEGLLLVGHKIEVLASGLNINIVLEKEFPAIVAFDGQDEIETRWPVLILFLADMAANDAASAADLVKHYEVFQQLIVKKVNVDVDVKGLQHLTLQNDHGVIDGTSPFEPFSYQAEVGSKMYWAHEELCIKQLNQLQLDISWLGTPNNFAEHYQGYYAPTTDASVATQSPVSDNSAFKANVSLYNNRSSYDLVSLPLFEKKDTGKGKLVIEGLNALLSYQWQTQINAEDKVLDWSRYWCLELESDFQQSVYPKVAAINANRNNNGKVDPFIVNTPYTPKIKSLAVDYCASIEIDIENAGLLEEHKLYHLQPFGYQEFSTQQQSVFPLFALQQYEGQLFIGIKDLAGHPNLSLLFQVAEGSADPDLALSKIEWDYLDGNQWKRPAQGLIVSDETNGLLNSGIISFMLPEANPGTVLPEELYWIRASIAGNARAVADLVAISAQAVQATFVDINNASDHLDTPLAANTIKALVKPVAKIKSLQQSYSSAGGKSAEKTQNFSMRTSERLRHKDRALTSWDYERLILDAFPMIYRVKALAAGTSKDPRISNHVQVIVIPDIRNKLPFNPFEPKVPADTLLKIEDYLCQRSSSLAKIKVINPHFLQLRIRCGVRFKDNIDAVFYKEKLRLSLQRLLSPWAFDDSSDIVFGGNINASVIIKFIEDQPYVDYAAAIKLYSSRNGHTFETVAEKSIQLQEATIVAPDTVIVSAKDHEIDIIGDEEYDEEVFSGVNYMKVGLDFKIAP
ncbi:MAG: hypothetical protein HRU20_13030 [Pseudomonadales bacterium]|nr:hypothetical protein [Pseudomonadales bacterium]